MKYIIGSTDKTLRHLHIRYNYNVNPEDTKEVNIMNIIYGKQHVDLT
jgi:hypothetical protein